MTTFVEELTSHVQSLQTEKDARLFQSLHWVMLSNGTTGLHECLIFFGFVKGMADPVLVAKVPRLPADEWIVRVEYDRLVELWFHLDEALAIRLAPRPISFASLCGQPTMITSYVKGKSLLRAWGRSSWRNPDQVLPLAVDAAHLLREIMDQTAFPLRQNEYSSDFNEKVEKFKQMHSLFPDEKSALDDLVSVVETSGGYSTSKVLLHGDFWHGNMIRGTSHDNLMLVDWQYSHWSVDASLDVYLFLLAGALTSVDTNDSIAEKARSAVEVLSGWKDNVIPSYLSAFGQPELYSVLPPRPGMLMCCVEKAVRASMAIGIDQEEDLVWRYMFSELLNWEDGR